MFYAKAKIGEDAELKIELHDENIYTACPGCGEEIQVDLNDVITDGQIDFYGTSIYCSECSRKMRERANY